MSEPPRTLTLPLTKPRPAPHASAAHAHLLPAIQSMLVLTTVALFFITFTFQPFRIPSASMEPTLLVGDFLLVDKQVTASSQSNLLPPATLHRGDVIVFHDPVDPTLHLVKRIIALPGDRIRLRAGHVLLNGHTIAEPYAVYRSSPPNLYRDNFPNVPSPDSDVDARWWIRLRSLVDHGDVVIPPNSYFVLGDNRNDSVDSRYWGLVPRAAIVGKPFLIYLSLRMRDNDPESESGPSYNPPTAAVSETRSLADFARWDRTLTVIR
ncbi:signal peptidase I [Granulicella sibirica]|nr:signal peptidase I [Granulicella sibirica]